MTKRVFITIGVIAVIAIGMFFILNKGDKKQEIIKIGAVLPMTGNLASFGETGQNGLLLAQDYINVNSLLKDGKKIEFVISDGFGVSKNSINALNHLLDIEKVKIVFSIISSVDISFIPIQKDKRFLFVSHATHPALSNVDSLFFRHSPTVEQEASIIKNYIGDNVASTVLLNMSDDYGIAFANITVKENFIQSDKVFTFNATETDFRAFCTKVIKINPEKVIICGNGKDLYKIVNVLTQLGYSKEIITTLGFKVGGAFEQVKNTTDFTYIDFKKPDISSKYDNIIRNYIQKYNKDMNVNEMIFFNSALLLVEAINKSEHKGDINEIAKNLSTIKSFSGMGENISISALNDILPELEILFNKK